MSKSKAASVLGVEFWANEIEVGQFRDTINSQESKLAQGAEEIDRFHAERSKLIQEASGLRDQVATLSSRMAALQGEHEAERSRLIREASGLQDQVAALSDRTAALQAEYESERSRLIREASGLQDQVAALNGRTAALQ